VFRRSGEIDYLLEAYKSAQKAGLTRDRSDIDSFMPFRLKRGLFGEEYEDGFGQQRSYRIPDSNDFQGPDNSASPKKTWLKRYRNHILQVAALICVIGAWVIGFYFLDDIEVMARYGYQGAFFVPMLDNFVTFINVGSFMIIAYLATFLNPFLIGLLAGVGATLGQITSYLFGYTGGQFVIKKLGIYRRVAAWMDKWGNKFIFGVSILPLPLVGFTGIAAGAAKYKLSRYFLYSGAGNILKHIGYCFLASWILYYLLPKIYELASFLGVSDRVGLILISIATVLILGLFSVLAWVLFKKVLVPPL